MTNEKTLIGIKEWQKEMIEDLLLFEKYWEAQRLSGNPNYPKTLGRGDWDEQFSLFSEQNKQSGS